MARIPRPVRNIIISVVVLIVLSIVGGTVYTLLMDQKPNNTSKPTALSAPTYTAAKPPKVSPKIPEGVAVESVTSPVNIGSNASIYIRTNPKSKCAIFVKYANGKQSQDSGLAPKTADSYGSVAWSWTVNGSASLGDGSATVTCLSHGHSGVVKADLKVIAAN